MPQRIAVCCAFVVALGACASKQAPPPAAPVAATQEPAVAAEQTAAEQPAPVTITDAELEALMGRAVAMFVAMADAVDTSGGDCDKLSALLDEIVAGDAELFAETKRYKDVPDIDRRSNEWMIAHQDQVMTPMVKIAGVGQKCASNEKFMAVMLELATL